MFRGGAKRSSAQDMASATPERCETISVGTKGTKLWGGINLNEVDIFKNGMLAAFNQTRAGQDAPLFDQMLKGINLGSGVVGTGGITASAALRANSTTR